MTEQEYLTLRRMHKSARPPTLDRRKTDPAAYSYHQKVVIGEWIKDWTSPREVEAHALAVNLTLSWQCQVEDISDPYATVCSTPPSRVGRYLLDNISCGLTGDHRPAYGTTLDVYGRSPWFDQNDLQGAHPEANDARFPSATYGVLVLSCRDADIDLDGTHVATRQAREKCKHGARDECRVAGKNLLQERKPQQALAMFKEGCDYEHDPECLVDAINVLHYLVYGVIDSQPGEPVDASTLRQLEATATAGCSQGHSVSCEAVALIYTGGLTGTKDPNKARLLTVNACRLDQHSRACYEACRLGDKPSCELPSASPDCALGIQGSCDSDIESAKGASPGVTVTPIETPSIEGQVSVEHISTSDLAEGQDTIEVPDEVAVSSTHAPGAGYSFAATNLVDGDLTTCWQPKSTKRGNTWIRLTFSHEILVTSLAIANGFQRTDRFGDEFLLNSRVATAHVRFSDNSEVTLDLNANERGLTRHAMPGTRTRSLTITVETKHKGTRWADLAVSEIQVTARR